MGYWENRQADLMHGYMQSAEDAAAEIARAYEAASAYMNQEIDRIFQRFTGQYGLSEAAAKRILGNVRDLRSLDSLRAAVEASGENADELLAEMNSGAYAARMRRWEDVQASLDDVMQRVYGYEQQVSSECYRGVVQQSYLDTIAGVEEQVGFSFSFAEISPEEIDTVMNMPFLGQNYSQRIWGNTQDVADSIREQMLIGVMTGKSQRQMAQEITERFGVGASNARRLVRTESAFVANEVQARAYEECGADKYEIVAVLDTRTSEICQNQDGKVYELKDREVGVNYPPFHPYCRSTTIIHIDDEVEQELEGRRIARNPVTGQNEYVPGDMTYQEWAEQYNQSAGESSAAEDEFGSPMSRKPEPDNEVSRWCAASGVEKREVREYGVDPETGKSLTPDSDAIISKVGRDEPTEGSCASAALAYAGNRAGYDVEDFRGGESRAIIARRHTMRDIAELPGVDGHIVRGYNDFKAVNELLGHVEPGREYILATGKHVAIIQRAEDGLQYLELQTQNDNGFHSLTRSVLQRRFSCTKSHTLLGERIAKDSILIGVESLYDSAEFLDVLGYINTATYS